MVWIFGYGSLIWRPNFNYIERRPAKILGWSRRFYQGSPDHRGTPDRLGRVVTLVPSPEAECYGVAYAVSPHQQSEIFDYLDIREQGGYDLLETSLYLLNEGQAENKVRGYLYTANADNPYYLGPASVAEMAQQIYTTHGPSGPNLEYFTELYEALGTFAPEERHLNELYEELSRQGELHVRQS